MKNTLPQKHNEFLEHYHAYFESIYKYISFRVGNRQDSEDLVSEIFIKALENYSKYTSRDNIPFSSWLFKIAKNSLTDFYRKNKRKTVNIEDLPEIDDKTPLAHTLLDNKILFEKAQILINELPKRQQEIVTLRLFGQLQNKEIATVLSISEKTVASTYMRAMQKISLQINPAL